MTRLTSNKLLPAAVAVVLLTLCGLAGTAVMSDEEVVPKPRTALPVIEAAPDGDTPVDTIRTLRAELTASNDRLAEVIEQNNKLIAANQKLQQGEQRLAARLSAQLDEKLAMAKSEQTSHLERSTARLTDQLDSLRQSLSVPAPDPAPVADAYPVAKGNLETGYIWIEPLDALVADRRRATDGDPKTGSLLDPFAPLGTAATTGASWPEAPKPEPFFTINNLATLAGSTAFTALIGRVPIGGQVADPVPFRVLVGRDNLAASGLNVPDEIAAMVFEGIGIGDWTLGCVEGSLSTATFIFEDGTIRTVQGGQGQGERLGYIADQFGTPCVAGERVSNAAGYLVAQVGLAAGAGAAQAFAAAQTQQVIDDGAIVSAVTGDVAEFALGRAAADATAEVQRYLANRLSSTFDAIYVPPGQDVALLIQQEITIDYDPNGRKLDYAKGGLPPAGALD